MIYYVTADSAHTRNEAIDKLKNYQRVGLSTISIIRIKEKGKLGTE